MKTLATIILNYKTADMTCRSADLALAAMRGIDGILVIVDNFSDDGSIEALTEWRDKHSEKDRILLEFSPTNTGFSGGNNIGLRAVDAHYYVLLNSDTLAREGAFAQMLSVAEENPRAGLIGPTLTGEDGAVQISRFRHFTPLSELINASGLDVVRRAFMKSDIPISTDSAVLPGWVSFACVMLRKEMIDEIGLMDDGYFLYFEDSDYCRTAQENGWSIALAPDAHIVHLRGGSSPVKSRGAANKRLPAYYYASRARYYRKHYGFAGYVAANLLWYAGRVLAHSKRLFFKQPSKVCDRTASDIWITQYHAQQDPHATT